MDRRTSGPLAVATLGAITLGIALAASPVQPSSRRADAALRIEADCRIVEAVRLEPLGDEADESTFASHARCSASAGPLRGASAEVDLVWAFDRGRLEHDATRWRTVDGALTTRAGTSIVRREADGRWRTDLHGTFAVADGRMSALAGRRYVMAARLDTSALAPVADTPAGDDDR